MNNNHDCKKVVESCRMCPNFMLCVKFQELNKRLDTLDITTITDAILELDTKINKVVVKLNTIDDNLTSYYNSIDTKLDTIIKDVENPSSSEWVANKHYYLNEICTYENVEYICILEHTSQVDWTPPITPTLWNVNSVTANISTTEVAVINNEIAIIDDEQPVYEITKNIFGKPKVKEVKKK